MRFGIFGFARVPYRALADRIRLAEALGFASAWVDDDLLTPNYSQFEPWTLLGALARDTSTIRLGTMVTAITFRHPSLLAAQVVTLDHISAGRAEIGLGAGGPPNPYHAFSHTEWTPRERAKRLEAYVAVLGPLLRGETVTHAGPHYPVQDAAVPPTIQRPRPPITIAAHGPRGLQVTARYADGWNSLGGQPYPLRDPRDLRTLAEAVAETKRLSDQLAGYCHEDGRDPAAIRRSVQALHPVPDPFASLDAFDEYVGAFAAIGIDELIFYWPPIDLAFTDPADIPPERQARFERIAVARISPRSR